MKSFFSVSSSPFTSSPQPLFHLIASPAADSNPHKKRATYRKVDGSFEEFFLFHLLQQTQMSGAVTIGVEANSAGRPIHVRR